MVSSLSLQLLKVSQQNRELYGSVETQRIKKPGVSILYGIEEALDQDAAFLHTLALSGIQGLAEINSWWRLFADPANLEKSRVFNKSQVDRSMMTRDENKSLDMEINLVLKALSPFFLSLHAQSVLEYLIRRQRVGEMNVDVLLASIICYHETLAFRKVLATLNLTGKRWKFLRSLQKARISPSRQFLVERCDSDPTLVLFLHFFIHSIMENQELMQSMKFSTHISFYTIFFIETINNWSLETIRIHFGSWAGIILKGIETGQVCAEWRDAHYSIVVALIKKLNLVSNVHNDPLLDIKRGIEALLDGCQKRWRLKEKVVEEISSRLEQEKNINGKPIPNPSERSNIFGDIRKLSDKDVGAVFEAIKARGMDAENEQLVEKIMGDDSYCTKLVTTKQWNVVRHVFDLFRMWLDKGKLGFDRVESLVVDMVQLALELDRDSVVIRLLDETRLGQRIFGQWSLDHCQVIEQLYSRMVSDAKRTVELVCMHQDDKSRLEFLVKMTRKHFFEPEVAAKTLCILELFVRQKPEIAAGETFQGLKMYLAFGIMSEDFGLRSQSLELVKLVPHNTLGQFFGQVLAFEREISSDRAQLVRVEKTVEFGSECLNELVSWIEDHRSHCEAVVGMIGFVLRMFFEDSHNRGIEMMMKIMNSVVVLSEQNLKVYEGLVSHALTRFVDWTLPTETLSRDLIINILDLSAFSHITFGELEQHWNDIDLETRTGLERLIMERYVRRRDVFHYHDNALEYSSKIFLSRITLNAQLFGTWLDGLIQKIGTNPKPGKSKRSKHPESDISQEIDQINLILELLQGKDMATLDQYYLLVPLLFQILETSLVGSFSNPRSVGFPVEHTRQLVLECLDQIFQQIVESDQEIEEAVLRVDLIVSILRGHLNVSGDQGCVGIHLQTQLDALDLLCTLSRLIPSLVLRSIFPVFVFMGTVVSRLDDQYTFHVIEKTVKQLVPLLLDSSLDRAEFEGNKESIVGIFVEAYPHIPLHRRVPLFRLLITCIPFDCECNHISASLGNIVSRLLSTENVFPFLQELFSGFDGVAVLHAILHHLVYQTESYGHVKELLNLAETELNKISDATHLPRLIQSGIEWCQALNSRASRVCSKQQPKWRRLVARSEGLLDRLYGVA